MTKLSVNINKIATLRNARGKNQPDLLEFTRLIIQSGAHGITVHPRPDERHIRYSDIHNLKELLSDYKNIEYNIEGYPGEKFLHLMKSLKPHQCTLVPDPPHVLTSNAGWRIRQNVSLLKKVTEQLKSRGVRVSLFLDPKTVEEKDLVALNDIAPSRVELYTEKYAEAWGTDQLAAVTESYKQLAKKLESLSIGINAGHDLNQKNLHFLLNQIPQVMEVSIGHALISEALKEGLKKTISNYLNILKQTDSDADDKAFRKLKSENGNLKS